MAPSKRESITGFMEFQRQVALNENSEDQSQSPAFQTSPLKQNPLMSSMPFENHLPMIDEAGKEKRRSTIAAEQKKSTVKQRKLSAHVCSRFYRAPEIILLEKKYGQAIDMWSLGVILYELLVLALPIEERDNFEAESKSDLSSNLELGDTCYPLSPGNQRDGVIGHRDQMRYVLDTVGQLDKQDMAFISQQSAKDYVKQMEKITRRAVARSLGIDELVGLRTKFASIKIQGLVDLLEGMLQFNPGFRLNARECLKHELFADLNKCRQRQLDSKRLFMPLYADDQFDYEANQQKGMDYEQMKMLLIEEVNTFRQPMKLAKENNNFTMSPRASRQSSMMDMQKSPKKLVKAREIPFVLPKPPSIQ